MKKNTVAIIGEYNPFHNGHLYQINKIRKLHSNDVDIIVILSSNFTQRCEPSIISKWARARQALMCGADCILELPVVFSTAPAESFAKAGVYIADKLGIIDKLFFSGECSDIKILKTLAELTDKKYVVDDMKKNLSQGINFPMSKQMAIEKYIGSDEAYALKQPNNILGVEYIKALKFFSSNIEPYLIERKDAMHDSMISKNNFSSAAFIRSVILKGKIKKANNFMPQKSYDIFFNEIFRGNAPSDFRFLERLIFFKLRTMTVSEVSNIAYVSEGLENRILRIAREETEISALLEKIKTKRYTYSRIRRIILYCLLGITKDISLLTPNYVRVLGINKNKKNIISKMKTKSKIPVILSAKEIQTSYPSKIFEIEKKASELYSLTIDKILNSGQEFSIPLIEIERT